MRIFGIVVIILFFITASVYAVFQSNIGKNWIRKTIEEKLENSPYNVKIERIEGAIPNRIELYGVEIKGEEVDVKAKSITLRPILWRLLKKEIAFKNIIAKDVSVSGSKPFDYNGRARLSQKQVSLKGVLFGIETNVSYDLQKNSSNFSLKYHSLKVKGRALFTPDHELIRANIQVSDPKILSELPFDAEGRIFGNIQITKEENAYLGNILWQIPNYQVGEDQIGSVKGEGKFTWKDRMLEGEITGSFAKIDFHLQEMDALVTGNINVLLENLQSLYIPDFFGKVEAQILFEDVDHVQVVRILPTFTNFSYQDLGSQRLSGSLEFIDPMNGLKGPVSLQVTNGSYQNGFVSELTLKTEMGLESWPFSLDAKGSWHHPFELISVGSYKESEISLQLLSGNYFNMPFLLDEPLKITVTDELFLIPETHLSMGEGEMRLYLDRRGSNTDGFIRGTGLPLAIFSFNPLEPNLGRVDFESQIRERNDQLEGSFETSFTQEKPFVGEGKMKGSFSHDTLYFSGNLTTRENPLLNFDVTLPIELTIWPFDAKLLYFKEAKGHITYDGRVEEFLDFFNLGSHHLEGDLVADLSFKNALSKPSVSGKIHFQNGIYENYYTGTSLRQIEASFLGKKNTLYLKKLRALDQNKGTFEADGEINLLALDNYPFRFDSEFTQFQFAQIDLVQASADGDVHIKGNTLSALLKGNVLVSEALLTIPDHIPRRLPELKVTYRHPIRQVVESEKEVTPYPLLLDLSVSAPLVKIEGRGLHSEWKGDFNLGGTFTSIATEGKLELLKGEFNLSSRSFKLSEGSLSFSGKEHEMPHLNLEGTVETKGILITARLSGPLDNPQVHLASSPPLPLSSIMSYLLFGQDISEIGGFQALQIVTSLASLAGTGPDVMESTRKSLGVDRLRVISDPNVDGGESIALEVGKYVSEGVLVTLRQGTEESSTNISVEIELKHNFVFEIESDQRQEQGKFTLKWNLNY